jgi:seryl-tRNA synthetase
MNQELLQELERVVKKAAIDGVLTEEASNQIKQTIEENKSLNTKVKSIKDQLKESEAKRNDQDSKLNVLRNKVQEYNNRETELCDREDKMTQIELEAQYERERVQDHKDMMALIFRNIETRRNVFTPYEHTPHMENQFGTIHQYGQPSGVDVNEETTKSE